MKKRIFSLALVFVLVLALIPAVPASAATFNDITARQVVANIKLGAYYVNFNNTVHADTSMAPGWSGSYESLTVTEMESLSGYMPVRKEYVDALKKAGFNAIRFHVPWYIGCDKNGNIRDDYMERVKELVDYAVDNNMYAIIGSYWDLYHLFTLWDKDLTKSRAMFVKVWKQVAEAFRDYNEKVIFEPFIEPMHFEDGGVEEKVLEQHKNINIFNQLFVDTVRSTGGNNAKRVLMITGYTGNDLHWVDFLTIPNDIARDKIIVNTHIYHPWDFVLEVTDNNSNNNRTTWSKNNPEDTKEIDTILSGLHEYSVKHGVPAIVGGIAAQEKPKANDPKHTQVRVEYIEYIVGKAKNLGMPCFYHESDRLLIDLVTLEVTQPEVLSALARASGGANNYNTPPKGTPQKIYFYDTYGDLDKNACLIRGERSPAFDRSYGEWKLDNIKKEADGWYSHQMPAATVTDSYCWVEFTDGVGGTKWYWDSFVGFPNGAYFVADKNNPPLTVKNKADRWKNVVYMRSFATKAEAEAWIKGSSPPPPEPPSSSALDTASSWARADLVTTIAKGFVPSDIQNHYTSTITRIEFCRLAVNWLEYKSGKSITDLLKDKGVTLTTNAFEDTNDESVLAAYALGIISGARAPAADRPGLFNPNGSFDREMAATLIRNVCRAAGIDVSDTRDQGFADISAAADWAKDGINFCRANGIMGGTSTTPLMFSPKMAYSREQSILTFNNIK